MRVFFAIQEMLARVGIPLQQSQQSYNYMTPTLRYYIVSAA